MITEQNFKQAHTEVGISIFDDWLSLDWKSFEEKRRQFLSSDQGTNEQAYSREVLKEYLKDAQLSAWVDCKIKASEIAITYKDVTLEAATIVIYY